MFGSGGLVVSSAAMIPAQGLLRAALTCALFVSLSLSAAFAEEPPAPQGEALARRGPWEVMQKENGIVAERRQVEGSELHEFQGRGVVDAPLARVFAVIRDAERRTEWMANCVASHTLDELPDTNQISYNRTSAPWPVAHRDVVLQGAVYFDLKAKEIFLPFDSLEHPKQPPVPGVVRMPFLRGHWKLTPANGGKSTHVEYRVHANPGGSLPGWVVNWVSRELPYKTLASLRLQVARREYPEREARLMARPEYAALLGSAPPAPPAPAGAVEGQ